MGSNPTGPILKTPLNVDLIYRWYGGIIFPWEAVKSPATRAEYMRKARFLLEFADHVNPKLMNHSHGPHDKVEAERGELERGMRRFIEDARADLEKARSAIIN